MKLKKYYATLPCGTKVVIPEDTLRDFQVLYKGVSYETLPIKNKPEEKRA